MTCSPSLTKHLQLTLIRFCRVIVLLLSVSGCGGGGSPAPGAAPQRGDLVSVESSSTVDVATVEVAIAGLVSLGVDVSALGGARYGVSINNVVYRTVAPDGRWVEASGVVAYPLRIGGARSPLLGFQHATVLENSQAPSVASGYAAERAVLVALAARGFIVAMPDYLGYGSSMREVHPFVHARGLSAAVVDMLRATRRLLASRRIQTNDQLFLTGYSEGGYATLAAQKEIEQRTAGEFRITASMPASGPYDMSSTARTIVGLAVNPDPKLVAFVFKAYDHWYGWNRLSAIFRAPYDVTVAAYTNDGNYLRGTLTTDSSMLFGTAFRGAFLGSGETEIKAAFAENDLLDWAPTAPTRLFHGVDDTVVPYFNATNAATSMAGAGSTSVLVVDCRTPAGRARDHVNCLPDYLSQVFGWFVSLASDL